jgi:CRP-like cAMP-binding protein
MLELGELNSHQYFGELALLEGRDKGKHKAAVAHSASVVSLSAVEVLLLSKYDFYHLIDQKTVSMMMAYADKFYLDESAIRSQIKEQSKWESYKKDLLREIRPGGASMSSRARGR